MFILEIKTDKDVHYEIEGKVYLDIRPLPGTCHKYRGTYMSMHWHQWVFAKSLGYFTDLYFEFRVDFTILKALL